MPKTNDYLVFEADEANRPRIDYGTHVEYANEPIAYRCVGSVTAENEQAAVQAIMAHTRRIGKYAVVPAVFIDFTRALSAEPEGISPRLNP